MAGSSTQISASKVATPVGRPFAACTRAQRQPLVTRPTGTPVAWHSSTIRSTGLAAQARSGTTRSRPVLAGQEVSRACTVPPARSTASGRSSSPVDGGR
ncbi:MAG TPA: hypothetical protein VFM55_04195 [Micromonosporaceae bacterium]|nr:hypothetical protein [Micromonosporaceae bacterium]